MKHSHRGLVSAGMLMMILACARSGLAKDMGPEQVIITAVTGGVTYVRSSDSNDPQTVMPFLKLVEGDRLELALGAHINVLFIVRGLGETWQGPKTLLFQSGQLLSQVRGTWEREHPKLLKSLLFEPQKVLSESALLRLLGQLGGNTRSIPVFREISDTQATTIEQNYSILRQEFGADDATPDLYRLSVLFEYGQYDRMLPLLQDLFTVYPDNPILLRMQEWVMSRQNQ